MSLLARELHQLVSDVPHRPLAATTCTIFEQPDDVAVCAEHCHVVGVLAAKLGDLSQQAS